VGAGQHSSKKFFDILKKNVEYLRKGGGEEKILCHFEQSEEFHVILEQA